jgi:hypothetical protein
MSYSIAGAEEKKEQKKIQRQLEEAAEVEKKKQQEKRFHDECEKVNQIIDEEYKTQIEIIEQDLVRVGRYSPPRVGLNQPFRVGKKKPILGQQKIANNHIKSLRFHSYRIN